jgi:hypothetical protein
MLLSCTPLHANPLIRGSFYYLNCNGRQDRLMTLESKESKNPLSLSFHLRVSDVSSLSFCPRVSDVSVMRNQQWFWFWKLLQQSGSLFWILPTPLCSKVKEEVKAFFFFFFQFCLSLWLGPDSLACKNLCNFHYNGSEECIISELHSSFYHVITNGSLKIIHSFNFSNSL